MEKLKILYKNILAELNLILKNKTLISILLVSPIFYSLFYGSIYLNKTSHELSVGIIDKQNSHNSRRFIYDIQSSSKIKIYKNYSSFYESTKELGENKISAVILIPNNFDKNLNKDQQATVQLFLNNSRFLISNEINKALNEIILQFNQELLTNNFYQRSNPNLSVIPEPINLDIRNIFNKTESYGDFLIPAIFLLILHQTLLMAAATSVKLSFDDFAKDKKDKNLYYILAGKFIVYILFYTSYSIFINTTILDCFNITTSGNIFYLIIISILAFTPTFILGALLATFFNERLFLFQLITLSSYPVFILSGYSWPKSSIPIYINYFAQLVPFTNYSEIFQKSLLLGASFIESTPHFAVLLSITFLYTYILYKRINHINTQQTGV